MGIRFAHFTVSGLAPVRNKLPDDYTPTWDRKFYRGGLDCGMVELSDFTDFVLPLADHMATTVTDSINYHIDTVRGTYLACTLYTPPSQQ
jgi:hypothetical protein